MLPYQEILWKTLVEFKRKLFGSFLSFVGIFRVYGGAPPYDTRHEKTCFCHMQTTKAQISLRTRPGLSLTWSETPKAGFLVTRLIWCKVCLSVEKEVALG